MCNEVIQPELEKTGVMFSIIIPVYNAESFIVKCLESVRQQMYKNYEIIMVNDGSQDNSESVISGYKQEHPEMKIQLIKQNNMGPAGARGNGIKVASGDYVAFLDADDVWYPDKLLVVYEKIKCNEGSFFYHDEYEVALNGEKKKSYYYQLGTDAVVDLVVKGNPISTSTVVVETNLLKANHTFLDGREYGEDIACWIALAKGGARFCYITKALGEYRRNENSLTLSNIEYLHTTYERLLEFCDLLSEYGYSDAQIAQIKEKKRTNNIYAIARFYHKNGKYKEAVCEYRNVLRREPKMVKAMAGMLMAMVKLKK